MLGAEFFLVSVLASSQQTAGLVAAFTLKKVGFTLESPFGRISFGSTFNNYSQLEE